VNEQSLGLRERKRIETRKNLEAAAIKLVARDGLEQASIEAISELAGVSPRTFFNYFDSKEEAVLGLRYIDISDEAIARHIDSHQGIGPVESVITLMVDAFAPALVDTELHKTRIRIMRQYPQLLKGQVNQKTHMAKQLMTAVQQITSLAKPQAEVLLALCMSGIRASMQEQVASGKKLSPPKLINQSIQIISEVTNIL